jgi:hypothetical protein
MSIHQFLPAWLSQCGEFAKILTFQNDYGITNLALPKLWQIVAPRENSDSDESSKQMTARAFVGFVILSVLTASSSRTECRTLFFHLRKRPLMPSPMVTVAPFQRRSHSIGFPSLPNPELGSQNVVYSSRITLFENCCNVSAQSCDTNYLFSPRDSAIEKPIVLSVIARLTTV